MSTWSSVTVPVMVGMPSGVSLTGLTVRLAVSVAEEKAVLPPLVEVSVRLPLAPLDWSQARKVIALAMVPL